MTNETVNSLTHWPRSLLIHDAIMGEFRQFSINGKKTSDWWSVWLNQFIIQFVSVQALPLIIRCSEVNFLSMMREINIL